MTRIRKHFDWLSRISRNSSSNAAAALAALGLACAVYWVLLLETHRNWVADSEHQVELRSQQMASALALQVSTLMAGLDVVSRNLAAEYLRGDTQAFLHSTQVAIETFPEGSIVQITVADARGNVVYSSRELPAGLPRPSASDRELFQRLRDSEDDGRLHVSRPIVGRATGKWVVQFGRALHDERGFAGVLVLSISPDYLADAFRRAVTGADDIATLLRDDGAYLARTRLQDEVLGGALPPALSSRLARAGDSGNIRLQPSRDGQDRYYAWHRTSDYPLVVAVGIARGPALAKVHDTVADSLLRNIVGTGVLLLAAFAIALLYLRGSSQNALLAESEERLQFALDGGDLGLWDWRLDIDRLSYNTRWEAMLGYPPGELGTTHEDVMALIHPEDQPPVKHKLNAHLYGESAYFESEHRMRTRDGHYRWILARGRITGRDAEKRPLRMVGTHMDITARKQAEAERKALEAQLHKLVAQVPGMVYQYRLRPDGGSAFPYLSPALQDIYQMLPAEVADDANRLLERVHPDDQPRVRASIQRSADQLSTWVEEYRILRDGGEVRWLRGHAKPEREEDGSVLWHGYIHDVTEERARAQALRDSEERLRLTVAAVRDGLWDWNLAAGSIRWDSRCFEMLGYRDQAFAVNEAVWQRLAHPDDYPRVDSLIAGQVAKGEGFDVELRLRTATGGWLWVVCRGRVVAWENGRPQRVMGTHTDISARVADANLRRALLDNSAAAIFLVSPQRIILQANARAIEIFSPSREDMAGSRFSAAHGGEGPFERFSTEYEKLRSRGSIRLEYPLHDKDGQARWFDISGTLLDPAQPEGDVIWTLIDITDRRRIEAELAGARARQRAVIEHFPGGLLAEDQARKVQLANRSLCELLALPAPDSLGGKPLADLTGRLPPAVAAVLGPDNGPAHREATLEDGRTLEIERIPILQQGQPFGLLWLMRDISERKRRETDLQTLASTDALTGLPNRRAFLAQLEQALARPGAGKPGCLLMLDVDHFKRVNDSHGHAVGDQVLVHVADTLRSVLRREDLPGRLGGEEFAVLLPGSSAEGGHPLAERLREALAARPAPTTAGPLRVTASIGLCPLAEGSVTGLLERADQALYEAKRSGRNRVVAWQPPAGAAVASEQRPS